MKATPPLGNNYTMRTSSQKIFSFVAVAMTSAFLSLAATASEFVVGDLKLSSPWVRASVPGQVNGAGYVKIDNKSTQADRLLSATTSGVNRVELHTVITENGVAKMREVTGIDVPTTGVQLTPGGYHIMFLGLKDPFKAGVMIPVTLKFEKAGEIKVNFEVKPPTHNPGGTYSHGAHKH
jgi:periplasmic copper chaperone A